MARKGEGVPLTDILAANPRGSQVRAELGDLSNLKVSMVRVGLLMPVLLTPDFQIIDGWRRVVAANELGWHSVAVLATDDWAKILDQLTTARLIQPKLREPMTYAELADLRHRILGPLRTKAVVSQVRQKLRPRDPRGIDRSRRMADEDFGLIWDMTVSHASLIGNLGKLLEQLSPYPEHLAVALDAADRAWRNQRIHYARNSARELLDKAVAGQPATLGPITLPDDKVAAAQAATTRDGVRAIDTLVSELLRVGPINAAMSQETATELSDLLSKLGRKLYHVRKMYRLHLGDGNENNNEERA